MHLLTDCCVADVSAELFAEGFSQSQCKCTALTDSMRKKVRKLGKIEWKLAEKRETMIIYNTQREL